VNGSLADLMDALVALEESVPDVARVYRWRPTSVPEPPAIYNWINPAPFEWMDVSRGRDTINLDISVAIRQTDVNEEMAKLEQIADVARDTLDPAFRTPLGGGPGPLGGNANWATRTSTRMDTPEFNGIFFLAILFSCQFRLDRQII
jgi:tetrahydromethanopterin S-methyltransferase subunit B